VIPVFQVGEEEMRKLIYCDFANPKADSRNYIEVLDLSHLHSVCEGYLSEFNNMSKKPMNLVLFRYMSSVDEDLEVSSHCNH
jgi:dynein heavy chain